MIFSSNSHHLRTRLRAGFGLIELLVSISIMVLVTSIVLARHSAFNGSVLLKSQAYEIALRLREVQLSAVSVATSTEGIRSYYGARFSSASPDNTRYAVFAAPIPAASGFYLQNDYSLVGTPGLIDKRFIVKGITLNCSSGGPVIPSSVIVLFKRPNYDAEFRDGNGLPVTCGDSVTIRIAPVGSLATDTGSERLVIVTKSGQISVQ